jgi:hypothetical protein
MQITDASIVYPTTSPENFSGLVSWHEADALNGIVAHNAPVQTCFDMSKSNFDVTQATLASRPKLIQGACNGHSVLRFDGVDDNMANTTYADFGDTYTVTVVCSFAPTAGVGIFLFEASLGANANTGFSINSSAGATVLGGTDSLSTKNVISTFAERDGRFHIFTGINSGTLLSLYIDGQLLGTTAYTAPNPSVLSRLSIGASAASGNFAQVDVAAIIIYNVARTDPERIALENNYCRRKFFGTES